jgi:16S rRNA (adenine1518-N6/adenine1519-N6)-dimethyltransferase
MAGHSKQRIEELLDEAGLTPRRRLGQNFLIDLNLMRLLVDHAELSTDDTVLEVGVGTGSLTTMLAEHAGRVVAVEIDQQIAAIAAHEIEGLSNVRLLVQDVLAGKHHVAPEVLAELKAAAGPQGRFKLVANLPYQVSAPLMINLLLVEPTCQAMDVTVQAEVADRMTAQPGTGQYGTLSIFLQATGEVHQYRRVPPPAFWPMPNVHSAMIAWRRDDARIARIVDLNMLQRVVEMLLRHRRKTIRSSLQLTHINGDPTGLLAAAGIDPGRRGETLPPEKFVELANLLAAAQ